MRINAVKYGYRKGRFTKSNASRLGKLGAEAKARKRMESPGDPEPVRVPEGELLGVLAWHAADGQLRRWTIRQGPRTNGIKVISKGRTVVCGWDKLMSHLRKNLSIPKRVFPP